MCTGLEVAALATTLATTAASTKFKNDAAKDVRKAQQAAQNRFNADVDARRQTAANELNNSIQAAGRDSVDQDIQEATEARAELNQPTFNTRMLLPGQGNASDAVKTAIVQSQDKGEAAIGDAGNRAAILAAFGDADLRKNIQLLQNSNRIGTQGNFAQGALPVLQAGLADAERAGDSALRKADIISAIGTVASAGMGMAGGAPSSEVLLKTPTGSAPGFSTTRVAPIGL